MRSSWLHRVVFSAEWLALIRLAKKADLVPDCPVVKPSVFNHSCSNFCKWFAPQGGWEAFYANNPVLYAGRNEEEEDSEEGTDFEDYESDDSFEYNFHDFENDFGDGMDDVLDELEYAFLFL